MKMSRIVNYIFLSALLLLASCTNLIEIEPTHLLTGNNAFKNLNDAEQHLNGIYASLRGHYAGSYGVIADMSGEDLFETSESLGNFRSLVDWLYVSTDGLIGGSWVQSYRIINDINLLVANIESLAGDEKVKNRLKGQGLAIRAMMHFDLLRSFGQNYDRNSDLLGVPIKVVSETTTPVRNTVREVYDQIYSDISEAKQLLNDVDKEINVTGANRRRIDFLVAEALLARVALYAKDYQTAITSSTSVINSTFDLALRSDYRSIWTTDAVANEVLWNIAFQPGEGRIAANVFFPVNNRLSFRPTPEFISLFDATSDVRYSSFFSTNLVLSTGASRLGEIVPIKFLGRNGADDGVVDYKAFRVAEMYLIRSEARAFSGLDGGDVNALADLNAIRSARISGYANVSLSGASLKEAISIERRKELFLEGHRWFDARRLNTGIFRGGNCLAPATRCFIESSDFRFVWPIPQGEILANPNIRSQQNQGYN
jgi:starch-binding outer membrane protein, SusD/RagB family